MHKLLLEMTIYPNSYFFINKKNINILFYIKNSITILAKQKEKFFEIYYIGNIYKADFLFILKCCHIIINHICFFFLINHIYFLHYSARNKKI